MYHNNGVTCTWCAGSVCACHRPVTAFRWLSQVGFVAQQSATKREAERLRVRLQSTSAFAQLASMRRTALIAHMLAVNSALCMAPAGSVFRLGGERPPSPGQVPLGASPPLMRSPVRGYGSAGMGRQLDALLRAATGGRLRRRSRPSENKSPGPVSVEFISPFLLANYLVQKHLAVLLEVSKGLQRLNFLPLAGTALLYVSSSTQMMLVRAPTPSRFALHLPCARSLRHTSHMVFNPT